MTIEPTEFKIEKLVAEVEAILGATRLPSENYGFPSGTGELGAPWLACVSVKLLGGRMFTSKHLAELQKIPAFKAWEVSAVSSAAMGHGYETHTEPELEMEFEFYMGLFPAEYWKVQSESE